MVPESPPFGGLSVGDTSADVASPCDAEVPCDVALLRVVKEFCAVEAAVVKSCRVVGAATVVVGANSSAVKQDKYNPDVNRNMLI